MALIKEYLNLLLSPFLEFLPMAFLQHSPVLIGAIYVTSRSLTGQMTLYTALILINIADVWSSCDYTLNGPRVSFGMCLFFGMGSKLS